MRKDVMMISAGLMMLAMASCDQTEIREITEDRVVMQPVDTIKVADHFYLDGYLSRTSFYLCTRKQVQTNWLKGVKVS